MSQLTKEQIDNLTRKDDLRQGSHKSRWMLPKDAQALLTAMDDQCHEVVLAGRMFTIRYDNGGKVFVKPRDGSLVPNGWYTPQLLRSLATTD